MHSQHNQSNQNTIDSRIHISEQFTRSRCHHSSNILVFDHLNDCVLLFLVDRRLFLYCASSLRMNQKFHITFKIAATPLAIFNKDFDNLTMTCEKTECSKENILLSRLIMKERDEVENFLTTPKKVFVSFIELSLFSCDCVHSRLYQRDIV